jgi:hypothetical protein
MGVREYECKYLRLHALISHTGSMYILEDRCELSYLQPRGAPHDECAASENWSGSVRGSCENA